MKKASILLLFLVSLVLATKAQGFYIKINPRYHIPNAKQKSPEYFSPGITLGPGYLTTVITSSINKFSIANGFSLGGILGYRINEFIGVELGLDYFKSNSTFDPGINSLWWVGSRWKFWSVNSMPTFVFGKAYTNSALYAKVGPIIGLSSLTKTILDGNGDPMISYKLKNNLSYGYKVGFEYNYGLNKSLSLSVEIGIENYSYTPKKAELEDANGYDMEMLPERNKKIEYVSEIKNEEIGRSYYQGYGIMYNPDEPTKRLKETLKMNSAYIGIGLIFKFNSREKV